MPTTPDATTETRAQTANQSDGLGDGDAGDDPVNYVYVTDSCRQFVVENCVLCGETHRHGAKDPTVAKGGRSHRAAHCTDEIGAGYYLELAPDAEPPARWWQWMERTAGGDLDA